MCTSNYVYNINVLYFKNTLIALYSNKYEIIFAINNEYCTKYKESININIPKFFKDFGTKNYILISYCLNLCKTLNINMFDFHIGNYIVTYYNYIVIHCIN